MTTVKITAKHLRKVINTFFEKENERVAKEHRAYLLEQSTKRRLFGLLAPREVDWSFTPTIYHSMAFQTMWPHHQAKDMLDILEEYNSNSTIIEVDTDVLAAILRVINK